MAKTSAPSQRPKSKPLPDSKLVDAYKITVVGTYYAYTSNGLRAKGYTPQTFVLPRIVSYHDGLTKHEQTDPITGIVKSWVTIRIKRSNLLRSSLAIYMIKKFYLPARLKSISDDYQGVREVFIQSRQQTRVDPTLVRDVTKMSVADMSEEELLQFHTLQGLATVLDMYPSPEEKRLAIQRELIQIARTKANKKQKEEEDPLLSPPDHLLDLEDDLDSVTSSAPAVYLLVTIG